MNTRMKMTYTFHSYFDISTDFLLPLLFAECSMCIFIELVLIVSFITVKQKRGEKFQGSKTDENNSRNK